MNEGGGALTDGRSVNALHDAFLVALVEEFGNVRGAARRIGISPQTAYNWKESVPGFKERFDEAHSEAIEHLEQIALQRATTGKKSPIVQQGKHVIGLDGEPMYEYFPSDVLMVTLLKGHRPEKYRDKTVTYQGAVTVEQSVVITAELRDLSGEELLAAWKRRQNDYVNGTLKPDNDPALNAKPVQQIEPTKRGNEKEGAE